MRCFLAIVAAIVLVILQLHGGAKPIRADESAKSKSTTAETAKELEPRTFSMEGKDLELNAVLAELAKQTGNQVLDRRQTKDTSTIKLELKKAGFWQALDAIAKAADARISLYERDGKLALADGPYINLPTSYSGLFRTTIKRIEVSRSLEAESHYMTVHLEIAWEPRFMPLLVETKPESLTIQDDKGRAIEVPEGGRGRTAVGRKNATELSVRLPAAQRSAQQLGLFKGKLSAVGPTKMVTFTFDKLAKIDKAKDARKLTQGGVTVHLRELRPDSEEEEPVWTAGLLLEYPGEGAKFESSQSWLVNNEIFLEKEKDGIKQQFPPNLGYEAGGTDEEDNKATIRYRFGDEPDKKLILGDIRDWKLVYRTPGRIAELPIDFEFKEVPLP